MSTIDGLILIGCGTLIVVIAERLLQRYWR